jgi:hypothetical protein
MPLIASSATPLSAASSAVPPVVSLAVDVEVQQKTRWCWAAIGSALTRFYRPATPLTQRQTASVVLVRDCQANPDGCNHMLAMPLVLTRLGFADGHAGIVPFEDLVGPLSSGRPIAVRVSRGGVQHFMLCKGYDQPRRLIEIDDPADGRTHAIPYDALRTGQSLLGSWLDTYTTRAD